jgi:hypothetical protein
MKTLFRTAALVAAITLVGACSKKADDNTQTSSGTIASDSAHNANANLQIADVALGRTMGNDKHVTNPIDSFTPHDTIFASVHTTGTAQNTALAAKWTFQDGQIVNERTETISPTGDAYTEFHISKPNGWPVGKYTLHVLLNGQEVQTKDFEVKK